MEQVALWEYHQLMKEWVVWGTQNQTILGLRGKETIRKLLLLIIMANLRQSQT